MIQAGVQREIQAPPSCFERLFLLELMVHEVCYDCAASMDQTFLNTLGPTIVTFCSDSFPPLEMSEDEFGVNPPFESIKVKFKSGKSSLFAFKRGSEGTVSDKAHITVSRRLPPGGCSSEYKFGTAYLKMSREFLSVLSSSSISSKCLKVSLDILNCDMEPKGSIAIFLRLSCFGLTIITQFQADSSSDNRTFTFKGDNLMPLNLGYNCDPATANSPQCGGIQAQNAPNNISEKAKDELIMDLLKVIKSSSMINYMLNQCIPRNQYTSAPGFISPNNIGEMFDLSSGMKFGRVSSHHSYPQYPPQCSPSRTHVNPNAFGAFFPNFQNRAQTFTFNNCHNPTIAPAIKPPFESFNNPTIAPTIKPPFESVNNPTYHNNMLTYKPKEPLSPVISENILCKPEAMEKINASKTRPVVPKMSLSRNSIIKNTPSRSVWYSTGGASQAVVCKRG